jgi:uncharacterized protein (UPF0332 family)
MNPSEFLDSAARFSLGTTEGDWRSAISRAYYAVFHHFREFFLSHGLNLGRSGQSHFNLYAGLLHCGIGGAAPFGSEIDTLRQRRVDADYDLQARVAQAEATDAVTRAQAVITNFQSFLQTIPPAQVVDGARQHLQTIGKLGKAP